MSYKTARRDSSRNASSDWSVYQSTSGFKMLKGLFEISLVFYFTADLVNRKKQNKT